MDRRQVGRPLRRVPGVGVGRRGHGPRRRRPRTVATNPARSPARPIDQIDIETARARPTGVDELDRVLGGGIVPGAVVLLAGEPGVGKSTLLLDVAARAARTGRRVLDVTGEESAAQVRLRAGRIDALDPQLLLTAETDLGTVLSGTSSTSTRTCWSSTDPDHRVRAGRGGLLVASRRCGRSLTR